MGLPIVSTAVGGIPDMLSDGQTGFLVPDNDDRAMVEAIRRLVSEPDMAARLSCQGRQLAERCSWEAVLPQWERLFDRVMAEKR